jgi:hypothetical protein
MSDTSVISNNINSDAGSSVPVSTTSSSDPDAVPKIDQSIGELSIKVRSMDGNEVYFKLKQKTLFAKVFKAYCSKIGADVESVRFLFDGTRVKATDTPESLSMDNEDMIEVMIQQTGGGISSLFK